MHRSFLENIILLKATNNRFLRGTFNMFLSNTKELTRQNSYRRNWQLALYYQLNTHSFGLLNHSEQYLFNKSKHFPLLEKNCFHFKRRKDNDFGLYLYLYNKKKLVGCLHTRGFCLWKSLLCCKDLCKQQIIYVSFVIRFFFDWSIDRALWFLCSCA